MKKGFTLPELVITTAVSAAVLTVGIPSFLSMSERLAARNEAGQIHQLISFTRTQAIVKAQQVTLCPLDKTNKCSKSWNQALTVFTDRNNNRVLDSGEDILTTKNAEQDKNVLRAFNNSVISFNERGFAGPNTGSMSYCMGGYIQTGSVFIISRNGRIRAGTDKDGDGIPETPNGKNIPCITQ